MEQLKAWADPLLMRMTACAGTKVQVCNRKLLRLHLMRAMLAAVPGRLQAGTQW